MSMKKSVMLAALAAFFGAAAFAADETPAPTPHEHAGKACCRKAAATTTADSAPAATADAASPTAAEGEDAKGEHCTKASAGCCAKHEAANQEKKTQFRCSHTGQVVDSCCCTTKADGTMHCTLAKVDVASCCCTMVMEKEKDKEKDAAGAPAAPATADKH